ncbi:MAG: hypothetical protein P4L46_16295 [Fimbriimonas sp.]|nr:hypothetical protein [Fimbriimonas sp.]
MRERDFALASLDLGHRADWLELGTLRACINAPETGFLSSKVALCLALV